MISEKFVSDAELVRRAREGERSAFALLMARYRASALRYALSHARNDEAAREAVQEASLRAYLALDRLREPERFGEWLRGIVRNVCRERTPAVALRWDAPELEPLLPVLPDTARVVSERADDRAVREAVALLSPALRLAVQRFYFEGWSIEETASLLAIAPGAVKVRLYEARRRLKPLLEGQFPERALSAPSPRTRGKAMSIPVHMVDLPPLTAITHEPVTSVATAQRFLIMMVPNPQGPRHALLANESGDRFLSLIIESVDFGMALSMKNFERLGLLDLTRRLLEVSGSVIEQVELQPLETKVAVAALRVRTGDNIVTVEARPTEALALAIQQNIPIAVATPLMEREGWYIPDAEATVARILARDIDTPFLIRVVDGILQGVAKWFKETDVETRLEIQGDKVMNGLTIFDKGGLPLPLRANTYPSFIPPDAFPAIVARVKHSAGMDPLVTDREQSGELTVPYEEKSVVIAVRTTPGEQGEILQMRSRPAPSTSEG